jgi:hypothetical protein
VKQAVYARELRPGDKTRFDNRVWQVSTQFLEPPDAVDLDLFWNDDTLNLHVGASDLFELDT